MTVEGVDYSMDRPNLPLLYSMGKRFVCRYLAGGSPSKHLTLSEAAWITLCDMQIVSTFESTKTRALDGQFAGLVDAAAAAQAGAAVGMPDDRPFYFGVDFDASPAELAEMVPYFRGVAGQIGLARTGVYGGLRTVEYMRTHNLARFFWQTYAWSGGVRYPYAHIYQYSNGHNIQGAQVDYDRAYADDFGQWVEPTSGPQTLPGQLPNITTDSSWDFTPVISQQAGVFRGVASTLDGFTNALNGMRR